MLKHQRKIPLKRRRKSRHYTYVDEKGIACKKISAFLGKGSFGSTYRMRNKLDDGIYAVKRVDSSDLSEVRNLVALSHPNIIRYFNTKKIKQTLLIAMELIGSGKTLKDCIDTFGHENCHRIILDVASALQYIHGKNIIHRDIKSGNIFLDENRVVLGDFGHSVYLADNNPYTPQSNSCGSSHLVYRAPEVLNGEEYEKPSDMFQLGCLFLELQTGILMDTIVGNSYKDGWRNTTVAWLKTEEASETFQDLLETESDIEYCSICIDLLNIDQHRRPSATKIFNVLSLEKNSLTSCSSCPEISRQ